MSLYTLAVYHYNTDGRWVREFVNPEIRMPFQWADQQAAELNKRYPDRSYTAVNEREVPGNERTES